MRAKPKSEEKYNLSPVNDDNTTTVVVTFILTVGK